MNKLTLENVESNDQSGGAFKVHLRVQQRNARQKLTLVAGFPSNHDFKALLKDIKKKLCCNGAIIEDNSSKEPEKLLQVSGDQRLEIKKYLIAQRIVGENDIVVHGY